MKEYDDKSSEGVQSKQTQKVGEGIQPGTLDTGDSVGGVSATTVNMLPEVPSVLAKIGQNVDLHILSDLSVPLHLGGTDLGFFSSMLGYASFLVQRWKKYDQIEEILNDINNRLEIFGSENDSDKQLYITESLEETINKVEAFKAQIKSKIDDILNNTQNSGDEKNKLEELLARIILLQNMLKRKKDLDLQIDVNTVRVGGAAIAATAGTVLFLASVHIIAPVAVGVTVGVTVIGKLAAAASTFASSASLFLCGEELRRERAFENDDLQKYMANIFEDIRKSTEVDHIEKIFKEKIGFKLEEDELELFKKFMEEPKETLDLKSICTEFFKNFESKINVNTNDYKKEYERFLESGDEPNSLEAMRLVAKNLLVNKLINCYADKSIITQLTANVTEWGIDRFKPCGATKIIPKSLVSEKEEERVGTPRELFREKPKSTKLLPKESRSKTQINKIPT